jgi:hypothetical protein
MREGVQTEAALVRGAIRIPGLKAGDPAQEVLVTAEKDRQKVAVVMKVSNKDTYYCLVVSPGDWSIFAEVGPVKSDRKHVSVKDGGVAEVDFIFGKG